MGHSYNSFIHISKNLELKSCSLLFINLSTLSIYKKTTSSEDSSVALPVRIDIMLYTLEYATVKIKHEMEPVLQ